MPLVLMDSETGEVIREYESGVQVISKRQRKSCRETDGGKKEEQATERRSIYMNNGFIKNNYLELREVLKELDPYEAKTLSTLANYIEYWSNCVVIGSEREITIRQISEVVGISERKMVDVLKVLKREALLAITSVGKGKSRYQYYLNPWIATRGTAVNATLKSMFQEYPIRTKGMRKWKDL